MNFSLPWLLFSFKGRVGRGPFALVFVAQLAFSIVNSQLFMPKLNFAGLHAAPGAPAALEALHISVGVGLIMLVTSVASLWISFASQAKRLHDFGWSGWWQGAPYAVGFAGALAGGLFSGLGLAPIGGLFAILAMIACGFGALGLLGMLLFRRGDEGANPFDGDAPQQPGGWADKVSFARPAPHEAVAAAAPAAATAQAPRAQAPRAQAPRAQAPRAQAPRAQAPRAQAPRANDIVLATYRPPQERRATFGRRTAA